MDWKLPAVCVVFGMSAPRAEAQVDPVAIPPEEVLAAGKTGGVPPEILTIPKLLAGIPDLAMEFKTTYYLSPLQRTRRFMKKGNCWRDEFYENGKLTNLLTFDGTHYYRSQAHINYLCITDDPHANLSTDFMISTVFRENPLYAWATILYPVSLKNHFRPPAFSSIHMWMDELRKHTIEPVELSPKMKRYRLTDAEIQREMVFELNEEGVWLPAKYQQKILAGGPGYDHTYAAEISNWKRVQVGSSTVRLPMRIETTVILANGTKMRAQTYEVVPGSIRAVPDTIGINAFRVPLSSATNPYIASKNWPPKDGVK